MLHGIKIIICLLVSVTVNSQSFVYSKSYFRWPLSIKPAIVANFGELRSNHWHMGLDIPTNQKENLPVYAAAEGYVARVSVKPFGYGKAIYINHPNGLTTVYGHLNKFFPKLDSIVVAQQYKQQSWDIDLAFPKEKFPIKKGEFIAHSGSTGASQGPHVHFEIRDTKTERCINPFFFNLPVGDAVPPVFTKLGMYDRNLSVYDQSPVLFSVKKTPGGYVTKEPIIKTSFSKLSFSIGAYDFVSGSTNPNGIYSARIFFDQRPLVEFALDSMDYLETDYVNAHIDYPYRYSSGLYLQNLFKLPGDRGRAYKTQANNPTIQLNDTNIHAVKIEIADVRKNTSVLNFKVQFSSSVASRRTYAGHKTFAPNYVNVFEQSDFELHLPENSLYDSIQPVFYKIDQPASNAVSSIFQFSSASIPVHDVVRVRIKPNVTIPPELKNKVVIKRTDSKGIDFRKAVWEKNPTATGWLAAGFSDFGSYQGLIDNIPPSINDPGHGDTIDFSAEKYVVFFPKDNTGIAYFRAELDGQWLMFSNDKGAAWIYNFDARCSYGVHRLKVRIEDMVGNATEKEWWFKRHPYTAPKKKMKASKPVKGRHQLKTAKKK